MYKLGVWLMRILMWTLVGAALMSYHSQEFDSMTIGLMAAAATCMFFYAVMASDLRNKQKNQATARLSLFERQELGAHVPVLPLPERPVMWYDGEVYDYFGTPDPTAPNLA